MKTTVKPRHLIIPALALAYAGFLIGWLNRGDAKRSVVSRSTGEAAAKPASALLAGGTGAGKSGSAGNNAMKNEPGIDRRHNKVGTAARAEPVQSAELPRFKPVLYTEGQPFYEGEPVTAYVRVGSTGRQVALTVNQGGEYPQLLTEPGEEVQIRLAFTRTPPGSPIALTVQDGGLLNVSEGGIAVPPTSSAAPQGKESEGMQSRPPDPARSTAGILDAQRQIGFAFRVSGNPGIHRVTVGSPSGETKVLEFWAGPLPKMKELSAEIEAIGNDE